MINIQNYSIIEYLENSKFYIAIGPLQGYINGKNDILYLLIDNLDSINDYIDYIKDNHTLYDILTNYSQFGFELGESMFISQDLYNDAINYNINILDNAIMNDNNIIVIDNHNLNYYRNKNTNVSEFSDFQLRKLYATFASIIIDKYDHTNVDFTINSYNKMYEIVLNYLANFKQDKATENIAIILGTTVKYNVSNTYTTCGCNSQNNNSTSSNVNCYDSYMGGLQYVLETMLSDINFYNEWFFVKDNDKVFVNDILVDSLIKLLEDFLAMNIDLSLSTNSYNCNCHDSDNTVNSDNINTIRNYIKLLNYIKDCTFVENGNKLKVYGQAYAELLPKLDF